MKVLLFIAQSVVLMLILFLGFRFVYRTGRVVAGALLVWFLLIGFYAVLVSVNLEWVSASMAASRGGTRLPEGENYVDSFPDGQHLLAMIVLGWVFGISVAAPAEALRKRRSKSLQPSTLADDHAA